MIVCFVKEQFWFYLPLKFFELKLSDILFSRNLLNFAPSFLFVLEEIQDRFLRRILAVPEGVLSVQSTVDRSQAF